MAVAPASTGDPLVVVLINYSAAASYDVPAGQWDASTGVPAVGAECVVVFDDDGDAWVPMITTDSSAASSSWLSPMNIQAASWADTRSDPLGYRLMSGLVVLRGTATRLSAWPTAFSGRAMFELAVGPAQDHTVSVPARSGGVWTTAVVSVLVGGSVFLSGEPSGTWRTGDGIYLDGIMFPLD